jgi:hypothetical protein
VSGGESPAASVFEGMLSEIAPPRSAPSLEKPTEGVPLDPGEGSNTPGERPLLDVLPHGTGGSAWQGSWKHTCRAAHPHMTYTTTR